MNTPGLRAAGAVMAAVILTLAAPTSAHSPHDVVAGVEVSPTFAIDSTVFAAVTLSEHPHLARSTDGGLTWTSSGAAPMLHGFQAMTFSDDFANDGVGYIATNKGGVWRTTDHGDTWARVTDGLPSQVCRDVAVSPSFSTDQTVVITTAAGLYRSTDGGDTWTLATAGLGAAPTSVAHAASGTVGTMFVGNETLYRSLDAGATWTALETFAKPIAEIATSPSYAVDERLALCFGRHGDGVRVSIDGGETFETMNDGLLDLFVNSLAITDDGTLFACSQIDPCYRAPGFGAAWSLFDEGLEVLSDLTPDHYQAIRVTPDQPFGQRVLVGAFEGLFVSDDAGEHFTQRSLYPVAVVRALDLSPDFAVDGAVFAGSYGGGVYALGDAAFDVDVPERRGPASATVATGSPAAGPVAPTVLGAVAPPTTPDTRRWRSASGGLQTLFSSTLQVGPDHTSATPTLYYTYLGLWRSLDGGGTWTNIDTPEDITVIRALGIAPDHPSDGTLVIGTNDSVGTWRSIDDGQTWTELTNGLPAVHSTRFVRFSPLFANDSTFFLATKEDGVFRTTDAGDTFTDVTGAIPTEPVVRAMEISPTYAVDATLFVGTRGDGLWRSVDGGDTWTAVTAGLPDAEDLSVESIAMSPDFANDGTVFVATLADEVLVSTDGGTTWAPSGSGLPETSCWALAIAPDFPADPTVLVSTTDWIYESRDAGATWKRMPTFARVDDLYNEIRYEGFWTNDVFPGNLSFGVRGSDEPGATSTFEFVGDTITWFGVLGPDGGLASVSVDGALVASVDTYSPTLQQGVALFSTGFDGLAPHEIVITVEGTANPASGGAVVQTDGFSYRFEEAP